MLLIFICCWFVEQSLPERSFLQGFDLVLNDIIEIKVVTDFFVDLLFHIFVELVPLLLNEIVVFEVMELGLDERI